MRSCTAGPRQAARHRLIARDFAPVTRIPFNALELCYISSTAGRGIRSYLGTPDKELALAMARHGLVYRVDAELGLQRNRQPPGQDPPTESIHHRGQIDEAARQAADRYAL